MIENFQWWWNFTVCGESIDEVKLNPQVAIGFALQSSGKEMNK